MKETVTDLVYHSAPARVIRGKAITLSAIVPVTGEGMLLPTLTVSVEGAAIEPILMKPCERAVFSEGIFAVLTAEIPASLTASGEALTYTLLSDGRAIGTYTVTFLKYASNADMPPLVFTEMAARVPSPNGVAYLEVMNPTDAPVDLYDYKLVRCDAKMLVDDEPRREMMITNEKGTLLAPGELAILRLVPISVQNDTPDALTNEAFVEGLRSFYPYPEFECDPAALRIVCVANSVYDEEQGKLVATPGKFDLPIMPPRTPHTVGIARRDDPPSAAFHSLTYGTRPFELETPVRRSSVWGFDPDAPEKAVLLSRAELVTPGKLADSQSYPDFSDTEPPSIIPLTVSPFYFAKGDMVMKLAVLGGAVTDVTLHVRDNDGVFHDFKALAEGEEDVYECTVPYAFVSMLRNFEYYVTARDSIRTASLGSETHLYSRVLFDNAGPRVLSVDPPRGYAIEDTVLPTVRIAFEDRAGLNPLRSKLQIDGKDVTRKAVFSEGAIVYTPDRALSYGEHRITAVLYDLLGNKAVYHSDFSISDGKEMNCYRGEVHAHTMDSDGSGFPELAMAYARDVGKSDFFSVTEHSHYLPMSRYEEQKAIADLYNEPGKFAALYGWEMTWNNTNGFWGHMNILGTDDIVQDINKVDMPQIYEYLARHPEAVAMFNHPGLTWGNFDEYAYKTPEADRTVCLTEIKGAGYDLEYAVMLAKGWHAAPVFNEDNHAMNWTTGTGSTGYVLAPALTRENIMDAFRRRRTYTTSDNTLKLKYKVNGEWLGSTLKDPEALDISVELSTENPTGIGKLQIIAEDDIVVAEEDIGARTEYVWNLTLPALYDYYYVRILADKSYTVTAPVWIERDNPLSIRHIRVFHDYSVKTPNDVAVRIDNSADKALKNLRVDFYLSDIGGFVAPITKPFETAYLDKVKAHDTVCVTRRFPNQNRRRRVTAIVSAEIDGRTVQCTDYVLLSSLDITAVVPNTAPITLADGTEVKNPFPYVQLFNTSSSELDLSDAQLRLWSVTGKAPTEDTTVALKGMKIPPRGSIAVWRKPKGTELNAADFNARYGTHLVEGVHLLVTEQRVISSAKAMRRIDVVVPGATLARVNYNMGVDCGGADTAEGSVLCYRYAPNQTGTARKITNTGIAAPDQVTADQQSRDFLYFEKKSEQKAEKHAAKRREKAQKQAAAPKVTRTSAIAAALASAAGAAAATAAILHAVSGKNKK